MFIHTIDEKVELLYDFCILRHNARKQEEAVREILGSCKSEAEMDRKLRDVLVGGKPLKEFINQYGGNN